MKRSTLLKWGLMVGLIAGSAQAQVFNLQNIDHGDDFTGYNGNDYDANYFGQGAYSDPGNNVWNGFSITGDGFGSTLVFGGGRPNDGLLYNNPGNPYAFYGANSSFPIGYANGYPTLFLPSSAGTHAGNAYSPTNPFTASPIEVPILKGADSWVSLSAWEGTGAAIEAGRQQVQFLFSACTLVNGANPGVGTAASPLGLCVLSNVPPGEYNLFLYGANVNNDRGASFSVSNGVDGTGGPLDGVATCLNNHVANGSAGGPASAFVFGADYVVWTNVSPGANGVINVYWGTVSNVIANASPPYTNVDEGDFCGLQLASSVPLFFAQQPNAFSGNQGGTTALTVLAAAANGSTPSYQWYSGSPPGTLLSGQTSPALVPSQAGGYFAVATSGGISVTSLVANVTLYSTPEIEGPFATNDLEVSGGSLPLTLTTFGSLPMTYFWSANGAVYAITTNSAPFYYASGTNVDFYAASSSATLNNITAPTTITCIASNSFGTVTNSATVTIAPPLAGSYAAAVLADNPIGYWPLNETSTSLGGSNDLAIDYGSLGAAVNGFYTPTAELGNTGPTAFGMGTNNYSPFFDGLGDTIVLCGAATNLQNPQLLADQGQPVTVAFWAQIVASVNHFATVVGRGDESYRVNYTGSGGNESYQFAPNNNNNDGNVNAGVNYADGLWHFVVGTWDGHTNDYIYVDGILRKKFTGESQNAATDNDPLAIGAAPDYTSRDFVGSVCQVAVFSNSLSAAQIQSLYSAALVAPAVIAPTNAITVNGGADVNMAVIVSGTPQFSYQWYGPGGVPGDPILDATNATLTLTNVNGTGTPENTGPGVYTCVVTNLYGTGQATVNLTVNVGHPVLNPNLPATTYALVGGTATFSVGELGSAPFTNAWTFNGEPLANGGQISGANTATLTIANANTANEGAYELLATNVDGSTNSVVSTLVLDTEPSFNTNGGGWTLNSSDTGPGQGLFTSTNVFQITDGADGENTSFFFDDPVYIHSFAASFTYEDVGSTGGANDTADGIAFVLQNEGLDALGGGGSELGYYGITPSAELCFELYNNADDAPGYALATDGAGSAGVTAGGFDYQSTAPVSLISGDPINVSLYYNGNTLSMTLTDETTAATFSTTIDVGQLSQVLDGNTAYVGFTGGTGGVASTQTISDFTFTPIPALTAFAEQGNAVISWPSGIGGYVLQQNSNLSDPSGWTTISPPYNIVGGNYQYTVSAPGGSEFYRLVLTP